MASIRDVAQRANVSTATVSHVINGTRYVSPELTERVQAVMEELSYRPDAVARSLRRRAPLLRGSWCRHRRQASRPGGPRRGASRRA